MLVESLVKVLDESGDRVEILEASYALAASADPAALGHLGDRLTQSAFLARLDALDDSHTKTRFLQQVLMAVRDSEGAGREALCLRLARSESFTSDNDRLIFVLLVLAAVTPMSEDTVALFRRTNQEGYFAINSPLLTANGSPQALGLFAEMMADGTVDLERRIDCIRTSVLPHRTDSALLGTLGGMLRGDLEEEIALALFDTLFDFRSKEWYGPAIGAPEPPDWWSGSDDVLRYLLGLADLALQKSLSETLRERVKKTSKIINVILETREP